VEDSGTISAADLGAGGEQAEDVGRRHLGERDEDGWRRASQPAKAAMKKARLQTNFRRDTQHEWHPN